MWVWLYDIEDLGAVRQALLQIPGAASNGTRPTIAQAAKQLHMSGSQLSKLVRDGTLSAQRERRLVTLRQKMPSGRWRTRRAYHEVRTLDPKELERWRRDGVAGFISLRAAEEGSGIPYHAWVRWGRARICRPLGKKLELHRFWGLTSDGCSQRMLHIERADYATICKALKGLDDLAGGPAAVADGPTPSLAAGPKRRGRKTSDDTMQLYKACYEAYHGPSKLSAACNKIRARFGADALTEKSNLRLYARRYAQRCSLPFTRRN
jgi:hypothetical protein